MSEESKKQLIAELTQEILRVCPFDYRPEKDAESIRQIEIRNEELIKRMKKKHGKVTIIPGHEFDPNKMKKYDEMEGVVLFTGCDYPVNDLSQVDDKNLTKKELLENLGCMIMQQLFFHPYRHLRLKMLNGAEVYRRENKNSKPESEADRLERCFGIVSDQNRRF